MLKTISRRHDTHHQNTEGQQSDLAESVFRYGPYALIVCLIVGAFLMPAATFSIDEAMYVEMARAMAETGSFSIASNGGVDGSPALLQKLTHEVDGQVYPQYPGAYGVIAAPFYALFGISGLILMNALSTFPVAALTYRLALRLFDDVSIARIAVLLLLFATFVSTYAFAIWPHMLVLALVVGATERAAASAQEEGPRALRAAALSGLALGCAMALRVDAFLIAIAIVIWLRLFGAPSRRSLVLAFAAGLAPALIGSALINEIKFGVLSPISYGPPSTQGNHGEYGLQFMLVSVLVGLLLLVDVSNRRIGMAINMVSPAKLMAASVVLVLALLATSGTARAYAMNVYVLVVDLQQLGVDHFVPGIVEHENGFVFFWGILKPALLQSIPFAALAILPVIRLVQGQRASQHALLFAVAAAPIAFYALTRWHGGYSLSMRYFLPSAAMLAILSAAALHKDMFKDGTPPRAFIYALIAGVIAVMAAPMIGDQTAGLSVFASAYGPLLLAAGLALTTTAQAIPAAAARVRPASTALAGLAIGWSAAASFDDLGDLHLKLLSQEAISRGFETDTPKDALVFSTVEEWLADARDKGVHVTNPQISDQEGEIFDAFTAADRCVFIHLQKTVQSFDPPLDGRIERISFPSLPDGANEVFAPISQRATCAPEDG